MKSTVTRSVASGNSRFTRSVHLERDLGEPKSLQGYVVTSGTRRVLRRIAPGIAPTANGAYTLTGPYGTGKSALALFSVRLLAGPDYPGARDARRLLREGDPELAAAILDQKKAPVNLLPIAITGSREPLSEALLRGVAAAAGQLRGRRRSELLRAIDDVRCKADAGRVPGTNQVVRLLETLLELASDSKNGFAGVFLVIDEMGKLLEHAALRRESSDVYLLQAIAELVPRASKPFILLGVLHQDFAGYADRLSARERADWEKVRGRFEDIAFEEPADEVLRLIALARSKSQTLHGEPQSRLPPERASKRFVSRRGS